MAAQKAAEGHDSERKSPGEVVVELSGKGAVTADQLAGVVAGLNIDPVSPLAAAGEAGEVEMNTPAMSKMAGATRCARVAATRCDLGRDPRNRQLERTVLFRYATPPPPPEPVPGT
jgi:hypothetical protein